MKKTIFTCLTCTLFMFALLSPTLTHAQTYAQDLETKKMILVLLQQVAVLQQQLLALQEKEAIEANSNDGAMLTNENNPIAIFNTNLGDIEIELFADTMPITTSNFADLAKEGFYDETLFHRVIDGFMIQGGDPSTKTNDVARYGTGGPGYTIADERVAGEFLTNTRGTISMANAGPNSSGSQFFINLVDNQNLDFNKAPLSSKHPVFGHVLDGMKIVDDIGMVETNINDLPTQDIVVQSITIK